MNNQAAAECCGSCEHCQCKWEWYCCYFQYEEKKKRLEELQAQIGDDWTENDEADDLHGELYDWEESNFKELTDSCTNHTPRNPIPIIELPGVKETVEAAYGAGYQQALDAGWSQHRYYLDAIDYKDNYTYEYMRALEAK